MQFQILGPLAIVVDGEPIRLGPPVQRRVLAALLLRRNEIVPRRTLISEIWRADADVFEAWELEQRKRGALFTYIARLRALLEPLSRVVGKESLLRTEDNGYRLVLDDKYVDETEFITLVRSGHDEADAGRAATALLRFDAALSLWRGRPLGEMHTEEFTRATVARLESVHLGALEARTDVLLDLGRHRDLFADPGLRGWIEQYPTSERLHRAYALTLHRCGQTAAALAACREGVTRLTALGVAPAALRGLAAELSSSAVSASTSTFAATATSAAPTTQALPNVSNIPDTPVAAPAAVSPSAAAPGGLDAAAEVLCQLVRRQWRAEIAVQHLPDPHPMPVCWLPLTAKAKAGSEAEERPLRTDDMPGFAAAFRALRRRRLVMLGPAGSGKTTAAIMLAVELAARRGPHDPVPILLSLSSWQPSREHLHVWLRARLAENYPVLLDTARFGVAAIPGLVADRRIVLILDGLDEVPASRRSLMIKAINRTLLADDSLVVTSRPTEYLAAAADGEGISGATVIHAQPLDVAETLTYLLASADLQNRASRWSPVTAGLTAEPGGPLASALKSPLLVMLARLVYAGSREPAELLDEARFPDLATIEGHLLDALVPALLDLDIHRETWAGQGGHDTDAIQRWLTFLARDARRRETYDITWWQLPDAVRPLAGRASRAVTVALITTAVTVVLVLAKDLPEHAAAMGAPAALEHTLLQGLRHGLAAGLGTMAAVLSADGVRAAGTGEPQRWWRIPLDAVRTGSAGGGVLGLIEGIGAALGGESAAAAVITGTAYGLGLGIAFGLTTVIAAVPTPTATDLRLRGRMGSLLRALRSGVAAGVVVGLVVGTVEQSTLLLAGRTGIDYDEDLVFGLLPGLIFGLVVGPVSALIHWSRRPIVVESAPDLLSTLAVDRRQYLTLVATVTMTIALAFSLGAAVLPDQTPAEAVSRGLGAGLAGGTVLALAFGFIAAWPRYQVARAWLALRRKVPWRLAAFLEEAHRLGVLRRLGATYQFRHAPVQDRLALPRDDRQGNARRRVSTGVSGGVAATDGP